MGQGQGPGNAGKRLQGADARAAYEKAEENYETLQGLQDRLDGVSEPDRKSPDGRPDQSEHSKASQRFNQAARSQTGEENYNNLNEFVASNYGGHVAKHVDTTSYPPPETHGPLSGIEAPKPYRKSETGAE